MCARILASNFAWVRQVTKVDMENGTVDLRFSEMIVNNLNLRFVDRKTGESKEDGATRPEVILRQLTTRPGQVGPHFASALAGMYSGAFSMLSSLFRDRSADVAHPNLVARSLAHCVRQVMHGQCMPNKQGLRMPGAAKWNSLLREQVYNIKQAKRDIDAVYSMGLFDDVNILPSPSEDSSMDHPKVWRRISLPSCSYPTWLHVYAAKSSGEVVKSVLVLDPAG